MAKTLGQVDARCVFSPSCDFGWNVVSRFFEHVFVFTLGRLPKTPILVFGFCIFGWSVHFGAGGPRADLGPWPLKVSKQNCLEASILGTPKIEKITKTTSKNVVPETVKPVLRFWVFLFGMCKNLKLYFGFTFLGWFLHFWVFAFCWKLSKFGKCSKLWNVGELWKCWKLWKLFGNFGNFGFYVFGFFCTFLFRLTSYIYTFRVEDGENAWAGWRTVCILALLRLWVECCFTFLWTRFWFYFLGFLQNNVFGNCFGDFLNFLGSPKWTLQDSSALTLSMARGPDRLGALRRRTGGARVCTNCEKISKIVFWPKNSETSEIWGFTFLGFSVHSYFG